MVCALSVSHDKTFKLTWRTCRRCFNWATKVMEYDTDYSTCTYLGEADVNSFEWEPTVPTLVSLPPEVLLKIFSYLSPQDLLRLASLHSKLDKTAFDGSLWHHLHPVAWAKGQRKLNAPKQALSEVSLLASLGASTFSGGQKKRKDLETLATFPCALEMTIS